MTHEMVPCHDVNDMQGLHRTALRSLREYCSDHISLRSVCDHAARTVRRTCHQQEFSDFKSNNNVQVRRESRVFVSVLACCRRRAHVVHGTCQLH